MAHPTDTQSDRHLGNLEARSTPWTLETPHTQQNNNTTTAVTPIDMFTIQPYSVIFYILHETTPSFKLGLQFILNYKTGKFFLAASCMVIE